MKIAEKYAKLTYTKKLISLLIAICVVDLQLVILLPIFGIPVQENVGVAIISGIIATSLGYLFKSFKETKEEELIKLEKEKLNMTDSWTNEEE